jgi:predicted Zn-dependent peptidase
MKPTLNKTSLPNGVRILTLKMPHVRSVSMGVWVNVGARDESPAENGLSHFIEHMIFKGTERRSAFQIAKEFDAIGGQTNAFTSMETTCYHARVVDAHLETMVDILSDIFLNSTFDSLEVERERPVICQEIGMVEDSPEEYVHVLAGTDFWGDSPLGRSILGSRETIGAFGAETLKTYFSRFYHPAQIIIAAAGSIDHDHLVDLLGAPFAAIQPPTAALPPRQRSAGRAALSVHAKALEQVHLCLSTRGVSLKAEQRFALSLLNSLMGGNMSSRLFQEIRERRGLAYSVYSHTASYVDTGMFGVYAAVEPNKALETTRLIAQALRAVKAAPVSAAELQDAKEYTKGCLLLAAESTDNQMARIAQSELLFERCIPLETILERLEAVTCEDLLALANTLFQSDQTALTVLGPPLEAAPQAFGDCLAL